MQHFTLCLCNIQLCIRTTYYPIRRSWGTATLSKLPCVLTELRTITQKICHIQLPYEPHYRSKVVLSTVLQALLLILQFDQIILFSDLMKFLAAVLHVATWNNHCHVVPGPVWWTNTRLLIISLYHLSVMKAELDQSGLEGGASLHQTFTAEEELRGFCSSCGREHRDCFNITIVFPSAPLGIVPTPFEHREVVKVNWLLCCRCGGAAPDYWPPNWSWWHKRNTSDAWRKVWLHCKSYEL